MAHLETKCLATSKRTKREFNCVHGYCCPASQTLKNLDWLKLLTPSTWKVKSCTVVKLFKKITQRATCVEPKVEVKEWSGCASMWLLSRVAMHNIEHGKNQREQFQISTMHTSVLTQMAEETIRRGIRTSLFGFWEKTRWKHQPTCYNLAKLSPHPYVERVSRSPVVWPASTSNRSNTGKMPKFQSPLSQPTSKLACITQRPTSWETSGPQGECGGMSQ